MVVFPAKRMSLRSTNSSKPAHHPNIYAFAGLYTDTAVTAPPSSEDDAQPRRPSSSSAGRALSGPTCPSSISSGGAVFAGLRPFSFVPESPQRPPSGRSGYRSGTGLPPLYAPLTLRLARLRFAQHVNRSRPKPSIQSALRVQGLSESGSTRLNGSSRPRCQCGTWTVFRPFGPVVLGSANGHPIALRGRPSGWFLVIFLGVVRA